MNRPNKAQESNFFKNTVEFEEIFEKERDFLVSETAEINFIFK
jgi:hypothetical protein